MSTSDGIENPKDDEARNHTTDDIYRKDQFANESNIYKLSKWLNSI